LSVYGEARTKLLQEIIFRQESGAYQLPKLSRIITDKYGAFAGSDVTQKLLLGMRALYEDRIGTSFTLGLNEVRLNNEVKTSATRMSLAARVPEGTAKKDIDKSRS